MTPELDKTPRIEATEAPEGPFFIHINCVYADGTRFTESLSPEFNSREKTETALASLNAKRPSA